MDPARGFESEGCSSSSAWLVHALLHTICTFLRNKERVGTALQQRKSTLHLSRSLPKTHYASINVSALLRTNALPTERFTLQKEASEPLQEPGTSSRARHLAGGVCITDWASCEIELF